MNREQNNSQPRFVQGELIDSDARQLPAQSLDAATKKIVTPPSIISILSPKQQRALSTGLQLKKVEAVVELKILQLHQEANIRILENQLASTQRKTGILAVHNQKLGALKLEGNRLAGEAIKSEIEANEARQHNIANSDLSEEDKQKLAQKFLTRAGENIQCIAIEHGLQFQPSDPSDAEG